MLRRSLILATALVAGLGIATAGAETRDLETAHSAQGISQVSIEVAVGDVTVEPSSDNQIHAHVHLTPRRGGILSSLRSGERQVREARLEAEVTGSELSLTIDAPGSDHRFEATWQVEMPTKLAVKVKVGVGDIKLHRLAGGCDVDTGVGDVTTVLGGGGLSAQTGVGDVTVEAPEAAVGKVSATTGVGDVRLRAGDTRLNGEGMVSKELSWKGQGPARFKLESGVGDIMITLTSK
jgi:hypothetical protein